MSSATSATPEHAQPQGRPRRVAGIDVARGLAALLMMQGHATDGWVQPAQQNGAYAFSRVLGTLPLPAFLLLAGASVVWRLAKKGNEDAGALRRLLFRRGMRIVFTGYALSFFLAGIDGFEALPVLLRSDVLHVIGLSIALCALMPVHDVGRFVACSVGLGLLLTVACPFLPVYRDLPAVLAAPLALLVDVEGYTRMPLVPLYAWFSAGALCAWVMRRGPKTTFALTAGASARTLIAIASVALVAVLVGHHFTVTAQGPLTRQNAAVVFNVIDLAGRGTLVLVVGALLSPTLPARVRSVLVTLGRGSLVAYVFHLPFCYGQLASPMRGRGMLAASAGIVVLATVSYAVVRLWPLFKRRVFRKRAFAEPSLSAD